jgi:hypothetical protein
LRGHAGIFHRVAHEDHLKVRPSAPHLGLVVLTKIGGALLSDDIITNHGFDQISLDIGKIEIGHDFSVEIV